MLTPPVVAAFYAGLCALLLMALTIRVVRRRAALRCAWGDAGDADLMRAIRAHGNAAETMPLMLILLALMEILGAPWPVLQFFGLAILGGRLLHAWSCAGEGRGWARIAGMAATFTVLGLGGAGLAAHAAMRMLTP